MFFALDAPPDVARETRAIICRLSEHEMLSRNTQILAVDLLTQLSSRQKWSSSAAPLQVKEVRLWLS
jgi:hypothetical protein